MTEPRIGQVARLWQIHVESERSSYKNKKVSLQDLQYLAASDYLKWMTADLPAGAAVLETGCGSGKFSLALAMLGYRMTTIDISEAVLANLEQNRDRLSAEIGRPLEVVVIQGDIERISCAEGTFDAVVSEGVLEHWLEPEGRVAVLGEMARVTRPGGRVVVVVPNGRHPLFSWWKLSGYPGYASIDEVPWFRYDCLTLEREMVRAGLTEVRTDGISPWGTLAVWPQWWIMKALAALARRLLPAPRWIRRKMGFNLVGDGKRI